MHGWQTFLLRIGLSFLLLLAVWGASAARAQQFSAGFAGELSFVPAPPFFNGANFDLLLSVTVAGAAFNSETQFSLSALSAQLFSIRLTLGALQVHDQLLFAPAINFKRNELLAALEMGGVRLATEVLLADLGPPGAPNINPGLIIEVGGRSQLGLGLHSFTGFGVTRLVQDLDTTLPCDLSELACLGSSHPDGQPDKLVSAPFVFSEEAVRADLAFSGSFGQVTLAATTLFTLAGFNGELIEADLKIEPPGVRFAAVSTFDSGFALTRDTILFEATLGPFAWRGLTIFSGAPIAFAEQDFKLRLTFGGFSAFSTIIFAPVGLSELRLGLGVKL